MRTRIILKKLPADVLRDWSLPRLGFGNSQAIRIMKLLIERFGLNVPIQRAELDAFLREHGPEFTKQDGVRVFDWWSKMLEDEECIEVIRTQSTRAILRTIDLALAGYLVAHKDAVPSTTNVIDLMRWLKERC